MIGSRYVKNKRFSFEKLFSFGVEEIKGLNIQAIVNASVSMSKQQTGALIVIANESDLYSIIRTGDSINAETSSRLIESIFFKNSPMHDGALIVKKDKIAAARCVLPSSEQVNLPPHYGMRHRAALGITEKTDASVVIVSEENGAISYAQQGHIEYNISSNRLQQLLEDEFPNSIV